MQSNRKITERLIHRRDNDRAFDLEFWQAAGAEARFAAAWQMVNEVQLIRGEHVTESRLQRSVEHLERMRG